MCSIQIPNNLGCPWLEEGKEREKQRDQTGEEGQKVKCRRGGEKAEKCESGEVRFACVCLLDFC